MSIREALAFQELQRQTAMLGALVEQLLEESATLAARVDALEASATAECGACQQRRANDTARQQRRRLRHVTTAEPAQPAA